MCIVPEKNENQDLKRVVSFRKKREKLARYLIGFKGSCLINQAALYFSKVVILTSRKNSF